MKKIVVLFLVIVICLSSLTSCFIVINKGGNLSQGSNDSGLKAEGEKIPAQTDVLAAGKDIAEKALEEYTASKDFEEASLTIVIADDTGVGLNASSESAYLRALDIQRELIVNKLNCKLYIRRVSYDEFLTNATAAHNSGAKYADLVLVPQKCIGVLHSKDMLYNLNEILGESLNADCYDAESLSQFSGGNGVYGVVGDSAITPGSYVGVYFNKDIANDCGITDLIYDSVDNGTFTFDFMMSLKDMCKEKYPDVITLGAYSGEMFVQAMFGASGMKYANTGATVIPTVADNGERFNGFINKMKSVVADPAKFFSSANAYDDFGNGKILFYVDSLDNASKIRGNYGVVPLPKYDDQQEKYYTYANENAQVFAVLKSNQSTEYVADLLRAYNETSSLVYDAWSRDMLDYALRDSRSYYMVRKLFDSVSYDFAYVYGGVYTSVAGSTYLALTQAVLTDRTYEFYVGRQDKFFKADMEKEFS